MNYDVVRGVLMLVVMLDHNDIVRNVKSVNAWFLPMTFHVAGFLILPFLVRAKRLSRSMAYDHAIRYLTPFFFALLLYAVAFYVVVARHMPLADWLVRFGRAFVMADPWSLHDATGFIVLWFLPALLSLVVLAALYNSVSPLWRAVILATALVAHAAVGGLSEAAKELVPQGLLIALYIFPLGIAARHAVPWLTDGRHRLHATWIACVVLLICWYSERGSEVEVATLVVPTVLQPLRMLATDLSDLSFLVVLVVCSGPLGRVPALAKLGQYSLIVYLVHPLLYKPVLGLLLRVCNQRVLVQPHGAVIYWAGALASVAIVASASLAVAVALRAYEPLRRLITPHDRDEWVLHGVWDRLRPARA